MRAAHMKTKGNNKSDETGEQAIQAARCKQLRKEVSKRMDRPGSNAEAVKVQIVRLGFSPLEVSEEIFRHSQVQ